jgi:hypothetical protein
MSIREWLYIRFGDIKPETDELRINCPFCENRVGSADVGHHLYVSLVIQVCHCFKCDYKATWIRLIRDVDDCSYHEAMDQLGGIEDRIPLYALLSKKTGKAAQEMPKAFLTIKDALTKKGLVHESAEIASIYVRHRLESWVEDWPQYLSEWGVWNCSQGYGKLVLPVERGWWQYRHIMKNHSGPKYVNPTDPKGDRLYNYQALSKDTVYIAEGIISAVCIGKDAVALCGKTATPEQIERLARSNVHTFVICLDSDTERETIALADALLPRGKDVIIRMYQDGDPASSKVWTDTQYSFQTKVEMLLENM